VQSYKTMVVLGEISLLMYMQKVYKASVYLDARVGMLCLCGWCTRLVHLNSP
jgi:hypothetical protein